MNNKVMLLLVVLFMMFGVSHVKDASKKKEVHVWTVEDSKAYAYDAIHAWSIKEFACLERLWNKESNWRANAYNTTKVMGRNAGGIPQLLGLPPSTPPTQQIDRGLAYILYRYGTACKALQFHDRKGWY